MVEEQYLDPQDTMARTLWGEARGEGYVGMQAVANVIMNRVNNPTWWGSDVVSVCIKPYQFSCWLATDPNYEKLESVTDSDPQFQDALAIARLALSGQLNDVTFGADSYQRIGTNALWSQGLTPVATIGSQEFYVTRK